MFCETNCTIVGIPDCGFFFAVIVLAVGVLLTVLTFVIEHYWLKVVAGILSAGTSAVLAGVWLISQISYSFYPDYSVLSSFHFWTLLLILVGGVCAVLTIHDSISMSVERDALNDRQLIEYINRSGRMPYSNYSPTRAEVRKWINAGSPS